VGRAQTIRVTTPAGRTVEAKRLGTDDLGGLACLEVQDDTIKAIDVAPNTQAGDWILAVGGKASGDALAIGIVSATNRPGDRGGRVLQADVLVPDDLAGAPLVDLQGKLVGIALPPRGRGRDFAQAAPAADAARTLDALAKDGRIRRGFLGITLLPIAPDIRRQLQIDHGIQVQQVMPGHAAQNAGVLDGDIILAVNGEKVEDPVDFAAKVNAHQPEERITLKILRGGQQIDLPVTLGERPGNPELGLAPRPQVNPGTKLDIGLTVTPVTPQLAAMHRLGNAQGLVVTQVAAGSLAERARPSAIKPGELISEIAKKPVTTVEQAQKVIAEARQADAKSLLLLVRSGEGTRYVVINLR